MNVHGTVFTKFPVHHFVQLISFTFYWFSSILFNQIPFNAWPGAPYTCSSEATILRFADRLIAKNLICCIRWPRGRDVLGACGQLATKNMEVLQPPPQEQLTRQRSTRISKE